MPDKPGRKPGPLRRRLANPVVRERIYRILSITMLLIAVGACVVLMLAYVMHLKIILVAFSGVLSMAMAFYLFIRLWPRDDKQPSPTRTALIKAVGKAQPKSLSPEEYRRQRAQAQKLIRDKAAPALAKAIRGVLKQEELKERRKK